MCVPSKVAAQLGQQIVGHLAICNSLCLFVFLFAVVFLFYLNYGLFKEALHASKMKRALQLAKIRKDRDPAKQSF